eukprot:TRINITY_DN96198_c0_g1_i1.p1 TRINITY_DN96198_c0_g1~~TRINITY_DN96198_c0_g1_i1.p1  ORF type:complete len:249 (+),score=48.80 TRINITY_DN96198_c0_g1_i1:93-839(+)
MSTPPDGLIEFRLAWLTEMQNAEINARLQSVKRELKSHAETLGLELRGPIFLQGSSLWLPDGKRPGDVDLIVPEGEKQDTYELLTDSSSTGGTMYDVQEKLWENARSGMMLLVEPDDSWSDEDWEAYEPVWAKGVPDAFRALTPGDKFESEADAWKKQWKNHKVRLDALIYLAQYFAEFHSALSKNLQARVDDVVLGEKSNVAKLIKDMNEASWSGTVEYDCEGINQLTKELGRLYADCQKYFQNWAH